MEIVDIIKEALVFPSQNLEKLAIYIVLTFVIGLLAVGGIFSIVFAAVDSSAIAIVGVILFILALIVGFIISGYEISILKSGIEFDDEAPAFDWKNDFITGLKMLVVGIVYFIIPIIIVLIVGLITNIPGLIMNIIQESAVTPANATAIANSSAPVLNAVPEATVAALATSITITAIVAVVVFIIFAFLQAMGESRLANTGNLGEAVNIIEAFHDIGRIGWGKVIAVLLLIIVVVMVIEAILGYIYGQIPELSILSIIITPYLAFFTQRAKGLLYSDIA